MPRRRAGKRAARDRGIARIDDFGVANADQSAALSFVQETYLPGLDEPPILLFDELDAYVTTMRAWTAMARRLGESALVVADGRMAMFAPLFALYAVRYLDALQQRDAVAYARTFGPGTRSRDALVSLLGSAERDQDEWIEVLRSRGDRAPRRLG